MNSSQKVLISGTIAAVIAIALIGSIIGLGIVGSNKGAQNSTATSQSGTLAVLLTDPPTVPSGVSAVYITYSDFAIHVSGAGNDSGWHLVNTQGQINLMSVINATQTVALTNVQSGTFNMLAFNITSAIVTYNGQNYTANLVYQEHKLVVPIAGGITITSGHTSAAVIDLTPTVLLLGNTTNPSFAFIPAARGYTIPAQSTPSMHLRVGERDDIHDASWWTAIERGHFEITSASLTPSSLSITVTNGGNSSILFRVAAVTSTTSVQGGWKEDNLFSAASISEFFVVQSNDSLTPISAYGQRQAVEQVAAGGLLLAPGASVTLTYTGPVTLGLLQPRQLQPAQQITSGQSYVVTLSGNGMLAQTDVTATS